MDPAARSHMVAALKRLHQTGPDQPPLVGEGLREQKKRVTRQQLSDTATLMFLEQGFDAVKVTDVAAACGVSEKTVYNYFPTKESLLLDREESMAAAIRAALGRNGTAVSAVEGAVRVIEDDLRGLRGIFEGPDDGAPAIMVFRTFGDLVDGTPSLRAAQRDLMDRMVQVAAEALAERAGLNPEDPEAQIAADAICGLWRIQFRAMHRYGDGTLPAGVVLDKVIDEVRRAARLIETGLWASGLASPAPVSRDQLKAAAQTAAEARKQVHLALREAKTRWREAARSEHDAICTAIRGGQR